MHPASRLLILAFSALALANAAQAQATQAVGAGQVLLAPRTADNSPPPAIGLGNAMRGRAVPTNQWYSRPAGSAVCPTLFREGTRLRF
jgi:opacity protein-like surface antigen